MQKYSVFICKFYIGVKYGQNAKSKYLEYYNDIFYKLQKANIDKINYIVINFSSPNTIGLRSLQTPEYINNIISVFRKHIYNEPIWIKISPDIDDKQIDELIEYLTKIGVECGIDGVVCPALEIAKIKQNFDKNILTVVPGIRLATDSVSDHEFTNTPSYAVQNGADFLVIGRPITQSSNPENTINSILNSFSFF